MAWLATRAGIFLLATTPHLPGYRGDVDVYQRWYGCCFTHGAFPAASSQWQYPPGAAVVFWLPGVVPGSYLRNFVLLALACDLIVLWLVLRRARAAGGTPTAAWYWVCAIPLAGSIEATRFDVIPVVLSVAAICAATDGTGAGLRGVFIGAGTALKLWPAVLLAGTPPGRWRHTLVCAATTVAAICVVLIGGMQSFVGNQNARGVEIESIVATPFMIWRELGWHGTVTYKFGAMQLNGLFDAIPQYVSLGAMVLALALVLTWRLLIRTGRAVWRPEFAADAPLAATLLFLVTNSVLSPQYLLWPLGLAAACLAVNGERSTQRQVAFLLLAIAGLTQAIYPFGWIPILHGSGWLTAVLALRNALLLYAAVLSCWRIYRASRLDPAGDLAWLSQPRERFAAA